jgi:hypothetical protein
LVGRVPPGMEGGQGRVENFKNQEPKTKALFEELMKALDLFFMN